MEDKPVEVGILKVFSPLDGLKAENVQALARKTQLKDISAGRILFKEGDTDKRTFYIVTGTVELRSNDRTVGTIKGGTPEARSALTPALPRKYTARAMDNVQYISIDSDLLDVLLTWDQTGQYEVGELGRTGVHESADWMTTLLQTKAFHRIPPANIQAIFMRMQRINYRAGDVVIKQGTEGDFFYVVMTGKCIVTRETPLNKEGIKLAELGPGDSFGVDNSDFTFNVALGSDPKFTYNHGPSQRFVIDLDPAGPKAFNALPGGPERLAPDGPSGQPAPAPLRGLAVLIVDDSPDTLRMLTVLLQEAGARVHTADSARTALSLIAQHRPDVLVSDLAMPGEDGFSLIAKVRALPPELGGEIPAIALTAHVRLADRARALSAGFQMFIAKPLEPQELISVLGDLTAHRRQ